MADTSLEGLLKFISFLGDKGLVTAKSASDKKGAVTKVMSVLDEEERSNILVLDFDQVTLRFVNMHGQKYTPGSLQTYLSKARSTLDDFKRHTDDPVNFRMNSPAKNPKANSSKKTNVENQGNRDEFPTAKPQIVTGVKISSEPTQAVFPIPIRQDLTIKVYGIPFDLSEAEANKIANVIKAMAE